jgi:hypothetical protein
MSVVLGGSGEEGRLGQNASVASVLKNEIRVRKLWFISSAYIYQTNAFISVDYKVIFLKAGFIFFKDTNLW